MITIYYPSKLTIMQFISLLMRSDTIQALWAKVMKHTVIQIAHKLFFLPYRLAVKFISKIDLIFEAGVTVIYVTIKMYCDNKTDCLTIFI